MTAERWEAWLKTKTGKRVDHWFGIFMWFGILLILRWVFSYEITVLLFLAIVGANLGDTRSMVKEIRKGAER